MNYIRARADMHVHTSHSGWRHLRLIHAKDSYSPPSEVYRLARARGMSFVAVTDHDTVEGALRLRDDPAVDAEAVIVGEELECAFPETGQWVHVNVYGIDAPQHRLLQSLKGDVRDVAAYCREASLLFVLNHPFQSYLGQKPMMEYVADILELFDHVEGLNGGVPAVQNDAAGALCLLGRFLGRPLIPVAGSDAHSLRRVGKAYTEANAATGAEFLEEVKAGRCRIHGTTLGSAGLLREVYGMVFRYYLRLYTGRGEGRDLREYLGDLLGATLCLPAAVGGLPALITLGSRIRQKVISGSFLLRLDEMYGDPALVPLRRKSWSGHR